MIKPEELDFDQFTGSETVTRHWTRCMVYTDGMQYVAEEAGAYWLLDALASYQGEPAFKGEAFQLWVLTVTNRTAVLESWTDTPNRRGSRLLVKQEIEHTDFPLPRFECYVIAGEHGPTAMLKTEY
jgi:hypothetical protein